MPLVRNDLRKGNDTSYGRGRALGTIGSSSSASTIRIDSCSISAISKFAAAMSRRYLFFTSEASPFPNDQSSGSTATRLMNTSSRRTPRRRWSSSATCL
jgi:hypothetical protein